MTRKNTYQRRDRCVIYNALPHFENPERLIISLYEKLAGNGRLTVAHSENGEKINRRHEGEAREVSLGLMPAGELAVLFSRCFFVDTVIDNDDMYVVSGTKK